MQVRDEEDIIRQTLCRWYGLGATVYVWHDRDPIDWRHEAGNGEWKMLDGLSESGVIELYSNEFECERYKMQMHINYLKKEAIRREINWIIPADADEVWHFPNNDPSAFFASLPQTPSWGEVPYYDNFPNGFRRLHTHKKCLGYLTEEMEISIGNHMILEGDKWPKIENHGIYIEHYPVRSYEQMRRKLINHMEVYSIQHPEHPHGRNWHLWQEMGEAFFQEKWKEFNPQT